MQPLLACLLLLSTFIASAAHAAGDISENAYNEAQAQFRAGRLAAAEEAARALTVARGQALGGTDRRTLAAWMLLTEILHKEQLHADLEAQIRGLLPFLVQVHGADHPITLRYSGNLITELDAQGKSAEMAAECRPYLNTLSRLYGTADKRTVRARGSYARALLQIKDENGAEAQMRKLLPELVRIHGAESPEALAWQISFIDALVKLGNYEEAAKLCSSCSRSATRVLDPWTRTW